MRDLTLPRLHILASASLLLLVLATASTPTWAQVTVKGVVLDPDSASIVGASVGLKRSDQASERFTRSDARGDFEFNSVLPGTYEIHVEYSGFSLFDESIQVGRGDPHPLRIVLTIAPMQQQASVTSEDGEPSVDTSENPNAASLSSELLDTLPILDEDYLAALSRFLSPTDVGTAGPALNVNGVEAENVSVSSSAIKEVKINHDPYDAEFARPGKGRIEVTTKSGSNEYHGNLNFLFRDSAFNARNAFSLVKPSEQRQIIDGALGGPLGRSETTSFLISGDYNVENLQSVVFAIGPFGPIQENVPSPTHNGLFSAQIDHKFSDTNRATLFFSHTDNSWRNGGVGGFTLPEAGTDGKIGQERLVYSQETTLSPSLVNQFHLLLDYDYASTTSLQASPKIVVQGAFTGGGAQADESRDEEHFDLNELLMYSHGKHLLKMGVDVPHWGRVGIDNQQDAVGTFYFSNLAAYEAQRPYSLTLQQGDTHLAYLEEVLGAFIQDDYRVRPNLTLSVGLRYDWQDIFSDNDDFAPRVSFAYSPSTSHKTVLRGGAGIFYDSTGDAPESYLLYFNDERLRKYVITNPGYPEPFSPAEPLIDQPVSPVQLDPNFHTPSILQYSFGLERQLADKTTLDVTYIGSRSFHLFRSRDLNQPLPPLYEVRPDPAIGVLRQFESTGRGADDSIEVTLRRQVTKYFAGMAQYRLGWARDDTGGIWYFPPNSYDLTGEWGRSDTDRRNRFDLLGTLRPSKLLNLGVALSFYTGAPYTITTGIDEYHDGRADARPPGVPRNSLQGPGYADVDLRWSHEVFLNKSKKGKGPGLTVAVDAFNVLNRVNYTGFVGDLSSPFFGHAVTALPPRELELSVGFKF
ncbi:MAG TPA: TonB-dependent receptor [Candidatus Acidoferrales bacterium]|nr:TonB-dependent receptor [Candidatus Acidoferrales bacterium]